MKKFYQTSWQGIPFNSFARVSAEEIAGPGFYEAFYQELFKRCDGWDALDPRWREVKMVQANLISSRLQPADRKVLSVGCGLGMVERFLMRIAPGIHLEVLETSATPLRWLSNEMPREQIHIGMFPDCLPREAKFDLIYLSGVDYCFSQKEWLSVLRSVRELLTPTGRALVICASLESKPTLVGIVRSTARATLHLAGLRSRGQFWGWLRSAQDHCDVMKEGGFAGLEEGTISDHIYWIEGHVT